MKTSFHTARSIRYARVALLLAAVSAVQACSSDTIVAAPTSVTREPVAAGAVQVRVSGTVTDDDGTPVAGVIVSVYRQGTSQRLLSVVSDQNGLYSYSLPSGIDVAALAVKDGYASSLDNHSIGGADLQWDLRIYRTPGNERLPSRY